MRVALVACSKLKRSDPQPARDLYRGTAFKAARRVAERYEAWGILSAKYGLLLPDQVVAPYEATLTGLGASGRRGWYSRVRMAVRDAWPDWTHAVVLAGQAYAEALPFSERPLAGLPQGRQVQALQAAARRRPVMVVGESPTEERGQVQPFFDSGSGARLEQLMGIQPGELAGAVDLANLWPTGLANPRQSVDKLADGLWRYKAVVLCGARVQEAFGFRDADVLSQARVRGCPALLLPHPSSFNRWWNDQGNRHAAELAARRLGLERRVV